MQNIEIFHFYRNLGYKIIPIHFRSKSPIFSKWNGVYNPCFIENYINNFKFNLNFGILLGDIVDIEGDSIESNADIDALFESIKHPVYMSKKSKHHLFRSNLFDLQRIVDKGIEYRGHKHQSVIPPSIHEDGFEYKWLTKVFDFQEIPFLPIEIEEHISKLIKSRNIKNKKNGSLKPEHIQANCLICSKKYYMHSKRFYKELHVLKTMGKKWECRDCRKIDLRKKIRSQQ
jgi:hypothetical protein